MGTFSELARMLGVRQGHAQYLCQRVLSHFSGQKPPLDLVMAYIGQHYKDGKHPSDIAKLIRASGWQPQSAGSKIKPTKQAKRAAPKGDAKERPPQPGDSLTLARTPEVEASIGRAEGTTSQSEDNTQRPKQTPYDATINNVAAKLNTSTADAKRLVDGVLAEFSAPAPPLKLVGSYIRWFVPFGKTPCEIAALIRKSSWHPYKPMPAKGTFKLAKSKASYRKQKKTHSGVWVSIVSTPIGGQPPKRKR